MTKKILIATFQSLTKDSAAGMGRIAYSVAEELYHKGLLEALVVSSKGKFTTSFPSRPVSFWSRYYLFAINKFGKYIKLKSFVSRYIQEQLYDRFFARHIHKDLSAILITTPYLYHSLRKASRLGIPVYFTPGNLEDNYNRELVQQENDKYGITQNDAYTYKPRLAYYNKSIPLISRFLLYNHLMKETYEKIGLGGKIVFRQGCLKPVFSKKPPKADKEAGKFKAVFLAYTVLLKGLQYMLEAWKDLQEGYPGLELHIGGGIDMNVQSIINRDFANLNNVFYHGHISDVPGFLSDKQLCIVPSIIEGGPVFALEAMYFGLPVVCTENCGVKDMVDENKCGWVVPIRDAKAIKEKIIFAYEHQAEANAMGECGRKAIASYDISSFATDIADALINKAEA